MFIIQVSNKYFVFKVYRENLFCLLFLLHLSDRPALEKECTQLHIHLW